MAQSLKYLQPNLFSFYFWYNYARLAVPASAFGGLLWDNVGAFAPFIVMMFFDGLLRMPIIYRYVPESKKITLEKVEDIQVKL
jgi:hypothetical protein